MLDFLSDSDDDRAVEELLAQAKDMALLDQVAAINCAGFANCDLPSNLESRFQNLKNSARFAASNREANREVPIPSGGCESKSSPDLEPRALEIPKPKSKSSPCRSDRSGSGSVSPPARTGCFLCSPKKVSKRGGGCEFSRKQRKLIKKAMEEEEKLCRETEKIARWATEQARLTRNEMKNFDIVSDSDDDELK